MSTYVVGTTTEIDVASKDLDGVVFTPHQARITITDPTGFAITVSGGLQFPDGDIVTASGYIYYRYTPAIRGFHEYEAWVMDGNGIEAVEISGFEIIDHIE